jgi:hypothetical protein
VRGDGEMGETGRRGDTETRRRGDTETRRRGDAKKRRNGVGAPSLRLLIRRVLDASYWKVT